MLSKPFYYPAQSDFLHSGCLCPRLKELFTILFVMGCHQLGRASKSVMCTFFQLSHFSQAAITEILCTGRVKQQLLIFLLF